MPKVIVVWGCGCQKTVTYQPERGYAFSRQAMEDYAKSHLCPACYRAQGGRSLSEEDRRRAGRRRDQLLQKRTTV